MIAPGNGGRQCSTHSGWIARRSGNAYAQELEEEEGRDIPDSSTFLALDAFAVLVVSSLIVLGLWKVEELIVKAIW